LLHSHDGNVNQVVGNSVIGSCERFITEYPDPYEWANIAGSDADSDAAVDGGGDGIVDDGGSIIDGGDDAIVDGGDAIIDGNDDAIVDDGDAIVNDAAYGDNATYGDDDRINNAASDDDLGTDNITRRPPLIVLVQRSVRAPLAPLAPRRSTDDDGDHQMVSERVYNRIIAKIPKIGTITAHKLRRGLNHRYRPSAVQVNDALDIGIARGQISFERDDKGGLRYRRL